LGQLRKVSGRRAPKIAMVIAQAMIRPKRSIWSTMRCRLRAAAGVEGAADVAGV